VVSKVMMILELLSDGKWHGIEELLLSVGLSERKFWEITGFLGKYGFVEVDEKNRKLKVNRYFQRLLVQPVT
jgi:DNA-binding IclR family transcriptional regulator